MFSIGAPRCLVDWHRNAFRDTELLSSYLCGVAAHPGTVVCLVSSHASQENARDDVLGPRFHHRPRVGAVCIVPLREKRCTMSSTPSIPKDKMFYLFSIYMYLDIF